jgi:hypothetical protein
MKLNGPQGPKASHFLYISNHFLPTNTGFIFHHNLIKDCRVDGQYFATQSSYTLVEVQKYGRGLFRTRMAFVLCLRPMKQVLTLWTGRSRAAGRAEENRVNEDLNFLVQVYLMVTGVIRSTVVTLSRRVDNDAVMRHRVFTRGHTLPFVIWKPQGTTQ